MQAQNTLRFLKIASLGLILFCSTSFAQTATPVPVTTTTLVPVPSAQAANQAQSSDNSAALSSAATAAAMASQCGPKNPMACIMAALAAIQAGMAAGAGDGAGASAGGYSTVTTGAVTTGAAPPTALVGTSGIGATLSAVKAQLAAAGAPISDDGSTMTLPDGTSVPLNASTSTDAGLAAAGLTPQQIAQGRADVAAASTHAGLGDAPAVVGGASGFGGTYEPAKGTKVVAKTRAKPSLSGLTKNLGSDKIGVSADDIFEMITRRYQAKDASGTFIKN